LRVKSLQITGFKSFVDRTVFTFTPGVTAIVGPNGCGKSNVVDAIRWAMGEQSPRRLRGKGMDDVIFAGAEGRSPVGLGEVVLTFDNGDGTAPPQFAAFSEIQVARRLYRSGESEYLINKVPVRLRDVLDFFRDTGIGTRGYTIVEQGRIAEIVSAKAEERRSLIEEAAGISKYKARRQEAERKLEATEQNLLRVSDVLGEIRRQISSIERQAHRAARYKQLREHQRLLDLSLAHDDREALLERIEGERRRCLELRDAVTEADARLAEREAALAASRLALAEHERAVARGNEALFALRSRIKEIEGQVAWERRERASLAEANLAREQERARLSERLRAARDEEVRLEGDLAAVTAALEAEARVREAAEAEVRGAQAALRETEARREAASAALLELLTRAARAEDRIASLDERRAEVESRLRGADEALEMQQAEAAQAEGEQRGLEEALRQLLADRDGLGARLRAALHRHEQAGTRLRETAAALRETRERREARRARLTSLREVVERREDLGEGVRHLLGRGEEARQAYGLRALVREVLEPETEVEAAVEAVLGERGEALIVAGLGGAVAALDALRSAEAGRAALLAVAADETPRGFVPLGEPLLERVRVRPGFEAVARVLLGGVNLVGDLCEAVRVYGAARLPCHFVTRTGDLLSPDGLVRGGSAPRPGGLARARELRELEQEVAGLDAALAGREAEQATAESELVRAGEELENLRNRHHTAALAVASHEKDLERTHERAKALGEAGERRLAERSALLAEGEGLEAERVRLEASLAVARSGRTERQRQLDAAHARCGAAARELSRLESVLAERRVQHQGRLETRDRVAEARERAGLAAAEAEEWLGRRAGEIREAEARREALATSIQGAEQALAGLLAEEETARVAGEAAREAFEAAAAEVRALEEQTRELRADTTAQREAVQQAELVLREEELRLAHLDGQVRERWGVDIASWKPPVPAEDAGEDVAELEAAAGAEAASGAEVAAEAESGETEVAEGEAAGAAPAAERDARREARAQARLLALPPPERRRRLEEVRGQIEAMGDVNLGAIEEHEELRERFRFLSEQKQDLEHSIAQLRDAIARINRTSRKRFRETFDLVNERFQENFPRLFRGGKASLALSEAEDVLDAGIEIMAQPPGKRLQNVNLLSGGEKTMTAVALLVSVFQVRPSPFFLLDEVDAALDDANIGRFNEMVVELARASQFLLITHNKRTIEVADVLYGVTMEEKGVSKLVSVDLRAAG
jgi:chromosome segregation protein